MPRGADNSAYPQQQQISWHRRCLWAPRDKTWDRCTYILHVFVSVRLNCQGDVSPHWHGRLTSFSQYLYSCYPQSEAVIKTSARNSFAFFLRKHHHQLFNIILLIFCIYFHSWLTPQIEDWWRRILTKMYYRSKSFSYTSNVMRFHEFEKTEIGTKWFSDMFRTAGGWTVCVSELGDT